MKQFILIMIVMFIVMVVNGQTTNIINIYNSKVVINNIMPPVKNTNAVVSKKIVYTSWEAIERLQWERMLEARRVAAFKSYLRRFDK
jgi:hypothetical protein